MALELHVWGPGFSLPSIDPHCLAAIAYLQQAVPRGEWKLVASSNPTLSPTNELPALKHGDVWIGGFRNIFHYIAQISSGEWVLDAGLTEQEGADCIAFSSFVESHGRPLLDLSLYVSSENYTAVTRPLYNTIQSFPMPYLTPGAVRAAAKFRTEHLGLSGLDLDTEEVSRKEHSIIPESLRTSRTTVSSLLAASPETNARIRLDALARNFLEPLEDLLGKKKYLVSDKQPSSLDCLALGYLSLMLIPELPQPWLSKTMKTNFPSLCAWTQHLRTKVLGPAVMVEDALLTDRGDSTKQEKRLGGEGFLPWKAYQNGGAFGVGGAYLATLADSIPVVGQYRRAALEEQHRDTATKDEHGSSWQAVTIASSLVVGVGLLVGCMFHQGIISWGGEEPERQRGSGLDAFGEAGAALSVYANQMDAEVQRQKILEQANRHHIQPIVEVETGLNGTAVRETTS